MTQYNGAMNVRSNPETKATKNTFLSLSEGKIILCFCQLSTLLFCRVLTLAVLLPATSGGAIRMLVCPVHLWSGCSTFATARKFCFTTVLVPGGGGAPALWDRLHPQTKFPRPEGEHWGGAVVGMQLLDRWLLHGTRTNPIPAGGSATRSPPSPQASCYTLRTHVRLSQETPEPCSPLLPFLQHGPRSQLLPGFGTCVTLREPSKTAPYPGSLEAILARDHSGILQTLAAPMINRGDSKVSAWLRHL